MTDAPSMAGTDMPGPGGTGGSGKAPATGPAALASPAVIIRRARAPAGGRPVIPLTPGPAVAEQISRRATARSGRAARRRRA